MKILRFLLPALASIATACGDPLAGTDYRGEALFKVEGQISTRDTLPDSYYSADFAVSMFWLPNGLADASDPIEQPSVTTSVRFPSAFTLRIFEAPSEDHFSSPNAETTYGLVMVYIDVNQDHVYDRRKGDTLVGGGIQTGLLYTRTELSANDSPTGEALIEGFNLVDSPCRESMDGGHHMDFGPPDTASCGGFHRCPPGTYCDETDQSCAVSELFDLVILPDFDLRCTPPS